MVFRRSAAIVLRDTATSSPQQHTRSSSNRYFLLAFTATPLLFALLSVWLGKECGWDLLNYHWYDPYALLHQRLGRDLAVAHHATYYNPLLDVPLYLLGTHAPGWVVGAWLGALYGGLVALTGAIAWELQLLQPLRERALLSVLLALVAAVGGGALSSLGSTSNDIPAALGIFAALWLLLRQLNLHPDTPPSRDWLYVAGVLAGMSAGFKLTTSLYAAAIVLAVLVLPGRGRQRVITMMMLAAGMITGFLLTSGYWLWRMWEFSGNPFFPYFNHLFRSPLLIDASYRDTTFLPESLHERLLFPWAVTLDSRNAGEWVFRDAKLLLVYVLMPLMLLWSWRAASVHRRQTLLLILFAAVSYVLWQQLFSIYRYLVPLEMFAGILIAALMREWPLAPMPRVMMTCAVLIAAQLLVKTDIERRDWSGVNAPYVQVDVPVLDAPPETVVLMSGTAPMAYVIPSFPEAVTFLRIDGWLVPAEDHRSGLSRMLHQRVARHQGPMWILFDPADEVTAVKALAEYGLQLHSSCQWVHSNLANPLRLCTVRI